MHQTREPKGTRKVMSTNHQRIQTKITMILRLPTGEPKMPASKKKTKSIRVGKMSRNWKLLNLTNFFNQGIFANRSIRQGFSLCSRESGGLSLVACKSGSIFIIRSQQLQRYHFFLTQRLCQSREDQSIDTGAFLISLYFKWLKDIMILKKPMVGCGSQLLKTAQKMTKHPIETSVA